MSVETVVEALQALHATVSGIASAPTALRASWDAAELPLAFTWPGPTRDELGWQLESANFRRVDRTYVVTVYGLPVAQGESLDEGYQQLLPILQALGEAYTTVANTNLGGLVAHIGPIADSGVIVVTYAGIDYHALRFEIGVTEKSAVPD